MTNSERLIRRDLQAVFDRFPKACLEHLKTNRHRLTRGCYTDGQRGCLMFLLSERLPAEQRIDSRTSLTKFFTGRSGYPACEEPQYQPARWLVRLIDGEFCERYENARHLDWDLVFEVLEQVILARQKLLATHMAGVDLRRRRPGRRGERSARVARDGVRSRRTAR